MSNGPPNDADTATPAAAGTRAIVRTLAILSAFQKEARDLGIADLADKLNLSASTVHRTVRALVDENYLAKNEETSRYYLGRAAVLLGQSALRGLGLHRAQPILDRLGEQTRESVNLGVREGNEMVVMMRVESTHPLRFSQAPGSRLPVHASAMGKVTLSRSSSIDEAVATLPTPLPSLTHNTIANPESLRQELIAIRDRGYSTDDEEAITGVRCLAAPVLTDDGDAMAAIGIQAPAVRMSRAQWHSLAPLAMAAAEEVRHLIPPAHHL